VLIFELTCKRGHTFEGWFESLEALQAQLDDGQITCPNCGSAEVARAFSAFAIGGKNPAAPTPGNDSAFDNEKFGQALQQAVHHYFMENFEDVGATFCQEALKIHYGVSPLRNIRGVSSPQEEEILREEGVEFFKLGAKPEPAPPKISSRKTH
jgi:hypothetical protein